MAIKGIEDILNILKRDTLANNDHIKLKQIIDSPIPESIKSYFRFEAEKLFFKEDLLNIKTDRFDLNSNEVKSNFANLENVIKDNCIFKQPEFLDLLKNSVKMQIDYLSRPTWTLSGFIFKDEQNKSLDEISKLFRYFPDYPYYSEIAIGYLQKKGINRASYYEFVKLLKKIDDAILKRLSLEEIIWMVKPLHDFLSYKKPFSNEQLSIDYFISFFNDKELFGIASSLELEKKIRGKNECTFEEILRVVEKIDNIYSAENLQKKTIPPVESEEIHKEEEIKNTTSFVEQGVADEPDVFEKYSNPAIIEEKIKPPDIQESFSIKAEDSFGKIIENHSFDIGKNDIIQDVLNGFDIEEGNNVFVPIHKEEVFIKKSTSAFELSKKLPEIIPSSKNEPVSFLGFNIQPKDEKEFIKKIFKRDNLMFDKAMVELSRFNSWKEASEYIDSLFIRTGIDPFSKHAVKFIDKIQTKFNTKG